MREKSEGLKIAAACALVAVALAIVLVPILLGGLGVDIHLAR